ncbi:MAG: hypothetical protein OEY51_13160, partial [Cyclobacteriaceae bacterium]|nr:hypothetical protein [Cyclobacteriaceae bacterium]
DFLEKEAPFLEISDHDFLSLILMSPAISIANANDNISLFEEIALNKMARKMSKGGYFLKADPVAGAMKYYIKNIRYWEDLFLDVINVLIAANVDLEQLDKNSEEEQLTIDSFAQIVMTIPYVIVRFFSSFFLQGEVEIVEGHTISKTEYQRVLDLGVKLKFNNLKVFNAFCHTFTVK